MNPSRPVRGLGSDLMSNNESRASENLASWLGVEKPGQNSQFTFSETVIGFALSLGSRDYFGLTVSFLSFLVLIRLFVFVHDTQSLKLCSDFKSFGGSQPLHWLRLHSLHYLSLIATGKTIKLSFFHALCSACYSTHSYAIRFIGEAFRNTQSIPNKYLRPPGLLSCLYSCKESKTRNYNSIFHISRCSRFYLLFIQMPRSRVRRRNVWDTLHSPALQVKWDEAELKANLYVIDCEYIAL